MTAVITCTYGLKRFDVEVDSTGTLDVLKLQVLSVLQDLPELDGLAFVYKNTDGTSGILSSTLASLKPGAHVVLLERRLLQSASASASSSDEAQAEARKSAQSLLAAGTCTRVFLGSEATAQPMMKMGSRLLCRACAGSCIMGTAVPATDVTGPASCQCISRGAGSCIFESRAGEECGPGGLARPGTAVAQELCTILKLQATQLAVRAGVDAVVREGLAACGGQPGAADRLQAMAGRIVGGADHMRQYQDSAFLAKALTTIPVVQLYAQALDKMDKESPLWPVPTAEVSPVDGRSGRHGLRGAAAPATSDTVATAAVSDASVTTHDVQQARSDKFREYLLRELVGWFKYTFFKWVNNAPCDACGSTETQGLAATRPTPEERGRGGAGHVELYQCSKATCRSITRFPRYNNPSILLDTRRGRCGEWANCFTGCCIALGFDARHVHDWTDHVWTEVYLPGKRAWVHVDPCEASVDAPLLYEAGWGKKPSYVIAFGLDHAVDVTRKYTHKWEEVAGRRTEVDEGWLHRLVTAVDARQRAAGAALSSSQLHGGLPGPERTKTLAYQLAIEQRQMQANIAWVEAHHKAKPEELQGRISGALEWRAARGELGPGQEIGAGAGAGAGAGSSSAAGGGQPSASTTSLSVYSSGLSPAPSDVVCGGWSDVAGSFLAGLPGFGLAATVAGQTPTTTGQRAAAGMAAGPIITSWGEQALAVGADGQLYWRAVPGAESQVASAGATGGVGAATSKPTLNKTKRPAWRWVAVETPNGTAAQTAAHGSLRGSHTLTAAEDSATSSTVWPPERHAIIGLAADLHTVAAYAVTTAAGTAATDARLWRLCSGTAGAAGAGSSAADGAGGSLGSHKATAASWTATEVTSLPLSGDSHPVAHLPMAMCGGHVCYLHSGALWAVPVQADGTSASASASSATAKTHAPVRVCDAARVHALVSTRSALLLGWQADPYEPSAEAAAGAAGTDTATTTKPAVATGSIVLLVDVSGATAPVAGAGPSSASTSSSAAADGNHVQVLASAAVATPGDRLTVAVQGSSVSHGASSTGAGSSASADAAGETLRLATPLGQAGWIGLCRVGYPSESIGRGQAIEASDLHGQGQEEVYGAMSQGSAAGAGPVGDTGADNTPATAQPSTSNTWAGCFDGLLCEATGIPSQAGLYELRAYRGAGFGTLAGLGAHPIAVLPGPAQASTSTAADGGAGGGAPTEGTSSNTATIPSRHWLPLSPAANVAALLPGPASSSIMALTRPSGQGTATGAATGTGAAGAAAGASGSSQAASAGIDGGQLYRMALPRALQPRSVAAAASAGLGLRAAAFLGQLANGTVQWRARRLAKVATPQIVGGATRSSAAAATVPQARPTAAPAAPSSAAGQAPSSPAPGTAAASSSLATADPAAEQKALFARIYAQVTAGCGRARGSCPNTDCCAAADPEGTAPLPPNAAAAKALKLLASKGATALCPPL